MQNKKWKIKKNRYKLVLGLLVVALCTGCSNKREEEQEVHRLKGISLLEEGKYEEALETFQKALDLSLGEIGKEEEDICFYKAETQYKLGNIDDAMATYTAMIDYNENAKAFLLRGNLYYSLGEDKKALKDYKNALEKGKKDYEVQICVFEALMMNGKEKEAKELGKEMLSDLEKAVKGKDKQAHYFLAKVYSSLGEEEQAKKNIDAYINSGEAESTRLLQLATVALEKEHANQAIECLTTALELKEVPNKQKIMKSLVIAYEKNKDFESAKKMMKEYLKIYPDDTEAKREFIFLETR